jgi:hypothetical protein
VIRYIRRNEFLEGTLPDVLFFLLLVGFLLPVWTLPFFPTLDAAGHVYNGFVLRDLLLGHQDAYNGFFQINSHWSPNWLSQILLSCLSTIFDPVNCERVVHSLYIVSFATGFRYLTRSLSAFSKYFSLLGFVFIYNYTFILGFLNFNLSVALCLWAMGVLHQVWDTPGRRNVVLLGLILIILYSSHLVGIVAFFVYLFAWLVVHLIEGIRQGSVLILLKKRLMPVTFALAPAAILLLCYLMSDQEAGDYSYISSSDIWKRLSMQAGLFCFEEPEWGFTRWNYYAVMAGWIMLPVFQFFGIAKNKSDFDQLKNWNQYTLVWLLFAAIIAVLAFYVPDSSTGGGGMLTIRFVFLSGMFAVVALFSTLRHRVVLAASVIMVTFVSVDKVRFVYNKQAERGFYIEQIMNASEAISEKGVLIFLDFRGGWLLGHYPKLLAAENKLVALDNLGAHKPFSPVQWIEPLRKNDQQLCWVGNQWNCDPHDLDDRLQEQNIYILKWGEFEERDSGAAVKERWNAFFERSCSLIHDDDQGMQLYLSIPTKRGEVELEKF